MSGSIGGRGGAGHHLIGVESLNVGPKKFFDRTESKKVAKCLKYQMLKKAGWQSVPECTAPCRKIAGGIEFNFSD